MKRIIFFIILSLLFIYPLTITSFNHPKVNIILKGMRHIHKYEQDIIRLLRVPDTTYIYIETGDPDEGDTVVYEDSVAQVLTEDQKLWLWRKSKKKFIKLKYIVDSLAVVYGLEK